MLENKCWGLCVEEILPFSNMSFRKSNEMRACVYEELGGISLPDVHCMMEEVDQFTLNE